jgi:hypothetical protein
MIVSCSNDGRTILWNVQQNCKKEKKDLTEKILLFNEPYSLMYVGHAHLYKMAILIIPF